MILLQAALQNRKQIVICVYIEHTSFDWELFIVGNHILLFLLTVSCFYSSHNEPTMRGDDERRRSFEILFSTSDAYLKGEALFRKNKIFWFPQSIESTVTNHSATDTNIFTPTLLLCIFSFKNFVWFKRLL